MVRSRLARCLLAACLVAPSAACRAPTNGTPAPAHPLAVTAEPFALAEVARRVGLNRIVVDGPPTPSPVVLNPGPGPTPWLDPTAMQTVTKWVAIQLEAADPTGAPAYRRAATAFEAQLSSLAIDYQSSLADCGRHDIVTADQAFAAMGARYGFADHGAGDAGVASVIASQRLPVVFQESGVATAAVDRLAQATHTKVGFLSTLTTLTPDEQANRATYVSLMTDNLAALRSALACQAPT